MVTRRGRQRVSTPKGDETVQTNGASEGTIDPYAAPLSFLRGDGRQFEIEAVLLNTGEGWVPRVFEGGVLVNRDDMPRLGTQDQAYDHGFVFAKQYGRTRGKPA